MAQPKENPPKDTANETPPQAPQGKPMPGGKGPIEYRRNPKIHLVKQGAVVKGNWVGRVLDRSVRVYYGAPVAALPEPVKAALRSSKIDMGPVTLEELGLKPKEPGGIESAIVNLTRKAEEAATPQEE